MDSPFIFDMFVASQTDIDEHGFVVAQLDSFGEEDSGTQPIEMHSVYGFRGRPLDTDRGPNGEPGVGCNVLVGFEGGKGHGWFCEDPRDIAKLPQCQKGESMQYGAAGQFIRCRADAAIVHMTTDDGTPTGRSISFVQSRNGFEWGTPWAKMSLGPKGFHVVLSSGARFDLSAFAGLPAPLDAIASVASISAGMVSLNGAVVSLGPTTGTEQPLAKATVTQGALTALGAAIAALQTEIAAIIAAAGTPGGAPITTALATVVEASAAAIAAGVGAPAVALPLLPSSVAGG